MLAIARFLQHFVRRSNIVGCEYPHTRFTQPVNVKNQTTSARNSVVICVDRVWIESCQSPNC